MKTLISIMILALTTGVSARTWTSADGSKTIEAELVSKSGDTITIRLQDGRTMTVKPSVFSQADQQYITGWQASGSSSQDWPAWRGPSGNNIAPAGSAVPTEFSPTKNVVWKTQIPGRGVSSPVVVGNKIFLTTADEQAQSQSVICLSKENGQQLWQTQVHQGTFTPKMHKKNTHATPTPSWDGERLIGSFYNNYKVWLSALDSTGKILWQKDTGDYRDKYQFGYAPSPVLHGTNVIVSSEYPQGFIAAFDRATGREVWRKDRGGNSSYSTPIVAKVGSQELLVLTGNDKVTAYNPNNGSEVWAVPAISKATCGTVT